MCKSQSATKASQPISRHRSESSSASTAPSSSGAAASSSSSSGTRTDPGSRFRRQPPTSIPSGSSLSSKPYTSSSSSALSLASLRSSLPEAPALYSFPELCAATNNFLAKRLPGASSSAWRCTLRGRDAVVIQRPLRHRLRSGHPEVALRARLAALGRSHHSSLARLLGASLADDHVYLVYEFVPGASLADCLRNPRNPRFTPLATWASRVQVAADVAHGLEYIHQHSSAAAGVHNRVKSSAVIVTEPDFRAKICHFGAADLAGEVPDPDPAAEDAEITPVLSPSSTRKGSNERQRKIEGTTGYMAPEVLAHGAVSRRSDVFAFGVMLLEMVSGEEPLKYRYDKERKAFDVFSLIETAREAIGVASEGDEEEERRGRVRRWVDRRLRDSFPVEAAEKLIRVALRCVETEAAARPDMTWVAGKISKAYLESKVWAEKVRIPTDFSVSMARRLHSKDLNTYQYVLKSHKSKSTKSSGCDGLARASAAEITEGEESPEALRDGLAGIEKPLAEESLHLRRRLQGGFRCLDYHSNRTALFDGIEEGGVRAYSSHEIDEHDNDLAMEGLQDRVNILKRLTGDIHEEVESHNRMLDRMGNDMDSSRGILSGTMDRFKMGFETKSSRRMATLVASFVALFLLVYFLTK
ncbi:unnamed protein product [Musa hybrid cultivar]